MVDVRAQQAEELVEPVRERAELVLVAQVPLPEQGRGVSFPLEHPGQRDLLDRQPRLFFARRDGPLQPDPLLVAARHQGRTRRRADRPVGSRSR